MALKKSGKTVEARFDRLEKKFDEFIDFVTTQFLKVEQRFEQIDQRFEQVDRRFEQIDQRFETVDHRLGKLEQGQDFMIGELRELRQENTVGAYRSRRMETWITKAAKKIDLPYNP